MTYPNLRSGPRALVALVALVFAALAALESGCVTTQPWEREILAKPAMSPDPDADQEALRAHVVGLREGAQGGFGAGGGGCGCN